MGLNFAAVSCPSSCIAAPVAGCNWARPEGMATMWACATCCSPMPPNCPLMCEFIICGSAPLLCVVFSHQSMQIGLDVRLLCKLLSVIAPNFILPPWNEVQISEVAEQLIKAEHAKMLAVRIHCSFRGDQGSLAFPFASCPCSIGMAMSCGLL